MGDSKTSTEPHERIDGSINTNKMPSGQEAAENGTADTMTLDGDTDPAKAGQEDRPPLPPRPSLLQTTTNRPVTPTSRRSTLQAKATTAVSSVDIQTLSFPDGSRGTFSTPASHAVSDSVSDKNSGGQSTPSRKPGRSGSEVGADDSASLMSHAPTLKANGDLASLLDEGLNSQSPAWRLLSSQADTFDLFETSEYQDLSLSNFEQEFDEIEPVNSQGGNEGKPFYPSSLSPISLTRVSRGDSCSMEVQIQALPYFILSWEANLQQTWRPKSNKRLHWDHTDDNLVL